MGGLERTELIRDSLISWYREQANNIFRERVSLYQPVTGKTPNRKLIMAPLKIIDYTVVHELIHLVHPDHSKDFWARVKAIIPDYKERQEWLRINGNRLNI